MQVKILDVQRYPTRKDGTPYVQKNGKPFTIVKIKVQGRQNEIWASGFDSDGWTKEWKAGEIIDVSIEEGDMYNGQKQWKFAQITRLDLLITDVKKLDERVTALEKRGLPENTSIANPEFDPNDTGSLPF